MDLYKNENRVRSKMQKKMQDKEEKHGRKSNRKLESIQGLIRLQKNLCKQ